VDRSCSKVVLQRSQWRLMSSEVSSILVGLVRRAHYIVRPLSPFGQYQCWSRTRLLDLREEEVSHAGGGLPDVQTTQDGARGGSVEVHGGGEFGFKELPESECFIPSC